jgi:hypothetical protein
MKKLLLAHLIAVSSFSPMAFADYCSSNNGKLETSFGTYQFATEKLCREGHSLAKTCEEKNVENAKNNSKFKRVDCMKKLVHFISDHSSEVDRIHEDNS